MQKIEQNPSLPALWLWLSVFLFFFAALPQPLWAQVNDPTALPTPADDELVVVAGGHGAVVYTADGTVVTTAGAGARLVASARSADDEWLLVHMGDGQEGWALRSALLIFERMTLPMIDLDVTALNDAATSAERANAEKAESVLATPTAAPATRAAPDTEESTTVEAGTNTGDSDTGDSHTGDVSAAQNDTTTENVITALVRTGEQRLNVRSGPGTDYPVIGKAAAGSTVAIIARNADQSWLQIRLDGIDGGFGWVATPFVAVTAPLGDLPIVDNVNDDAVVLAAAGGNIAGGTAANDAAPSRAQPAGLQGKLVFVARNGGTIYLYNLASGALQPLTTGNDPSLSPDGTQVAFTRGGGENGIYLINVDGSNERKIFGERELLRSPKWSPDGRWLVFSRGDEFNKCYLDEDTGECLRFTPFFTEGLETGKDHVRKLARVDTNGDNYRDLAVVPEAFAPDWGNGGIVYQSAAGLQITQDTPEDNNRLLYFEIRRQYHQDPVWQPGSGGRIIFQQRQGSHYEIFAINSDGSGLVALTRPVTAFFDQLPSNVSPAWSPDGQSIVFLSNRTAENEAGAWRLWVMNADGSNQRPLPITVPLDYGYALEQMVDWGP
ncbi:MAG: PD40 domain-containing protein [Caldilineaceae bacterium]|nr:PD40 domain-containing protein [Caldilineaceae bacterium]